MPLFRQNVVRVGAVMAGLVLAATCGTLTAAEGETPDPSTPAQIVIEGDGGIAALHRETRIDSASGAYTYVMRPICAAGSTACQPLHERSGTLTRAEIDGLFVRAAAPEFRSLRADYGVTTSGADMIAYEVTIVTNGRRRSLKADDGTMPTILAQFMNDVSSLTLGAN